MFQLILVKGLGLENTEEKLVHNDVWAMEGEPSFL